MIIPIGWLQSFFPKKLKLSSFTDRFIQAGIEIEACTIPAVIPDEVVIGKVVSQDKHPNADRLSVCSVQCGDGVDRTIVCGAPNVAAGQTVAVALPGAVLPGGMTIKQTEIRGVKSEGMICAEDELGLGQDHAGILVLDSTYKPGVKVNTLQLGETLLDVKTPPNRIDWLSFVGIARELGAMSGTKPIFPKSVLRESNPSTKSYIRTRIQKGAALQYHLRMARNVRANVSPGWMAARLRATGITPSNLLVDATNYVMRELGQPLHAFDADMIRGKIITVRFAKPKEIIETLDGETRMLTPQDIVIADAKGPIAIAGVMGGKRTSVTKQTKNVLIESAIFPRVQLRKTSRRLGLLSDASSYFERGIIQDAPLQAIDRVACLYQELSNAKIAKGTVSFAGEIKKPTAISFSLARVNALLGTSFSLNEAKEILKRYGIGTRTTGRSTLVCTIPAYRPDLLVEADLAEELVRMKGFSAIKKTLPHMEVRVSVVDPSLRCMNMLRDSLVRSGYTEVYLPAYYGERDLQHATLPPNEHREIENPLDSQQKFLRSDLLPGLLEAMYKNRKSYRDMKLFEVGQVFWKNMKPGMHEWRIAFAVSFQAGGSYQEALQDFIDAVCSPLHIHATDVVLGKGRLNRDIRIHVTPVGHIVVKQIKNISIAAVECAISELIICERKPEYSPLPKFPGVKRDLAISVPSDLDRFTLERQIRRASSLVRDVALFDVRPLEENRISFAFHLDFSADDRTLADKDIAMEMLSIERAINEKGGKIRT